MAGAALIFSIVDTQAKYLTGTVEPMVIAWSRQIGLGIAAIGFVVVYGPRVLETQFLLLQLVRGVLSGISAALYVIALMFVPLVDAIAVTFTVPFFTVLLAACLLREPLNCRRLAIVSVGFLGAIVMARPGLGGLSPAIFLVFLEAFLYSMRQIITRKVAVTDGLPTTLVYTGVAGGIILSIPLALFCEFPSSLLEVGMLFEIGILAAVAEILVIVALSCALAVAVAPVHYSMLVWGTLLSWAVFDQLPDAYTVLGAAVIVLAGIALVFTERPAPR